MTSRSTEADDDRGETVVPLHEERVVVSKRKAERVAVRVTKRVETRDASVEAEATREDVRIERVPVDRVVDRAPPVRTEGMTTIIPVVEEVVVEKKLVVREEVRITRTRSNEPRAMKVALRREVADVSRVGRKR
jgi:uncharacterized protein (TIGR02271 family)